MIIPYPNYQKRKFKKTALSTSLSASIVLLTVACTDKHTSTTSQDSATTQTFPAKVFDLSQWKITLPMDANNDGKVDEIKVQDLQHYVHPDYFYLDAEQNMVFASPNVAITTANSKNTRSELRHMLRGTNTQISTKAPQNNFAIASHPNAAEFESIGGKLSASLRVDHVSVSGNPEMLPSYSVVVGQIHAGKDKVPANGFGYGNEPLKIYYKKFPEHNTGSVFWNYERNLAKEDPNRTDIAYPVWGNTWDNNSDPADNGIALGEEFSYVVNVHGDIMHLTFTSEGRKTIEFSVNLANNIDPYGNVDEKDLALGYAGDWHYFKAGAYNQCNAGTTHPFWGTGCRGTGDWATDQEKGDYTQVTFTQLTVGQSEPVE